MAAKDLTYQIAELRSTLQTFTRKFTHDRDESLDLVQDTILRALTYKDKFRENTNLKGWLFVIMRNTFVNNYRKNRRSRNFKDLAKDVYLISAEDQHTFNRPHETMEFKEIWSNVNNLKNELSMPFKMHSTGYKYHEIAEHLGIPIGTVKNRIFHARKEIQKKLQGY